MALPWLIIAVPLEGKRRMQSHRMLEQEGVALVICAVDQLATLLHSYDPFSWGLIHPLFGLINTAYVEAGFRCHFNGDYPCAWGAIKALRAFVKVPEGRRSPETQRAIEEGVAFLLDGDLAHARYPTKPGMGISQQWFRFGFPRGYQSDILQALEALTCLGYAHDARLQPALDFVLQKRRTDGTWRLDETPKLM